MFADFALEMIDLPEARLRVRYGGHGPAVLLRRAGRRVACPTLALWARRDDLEPLYGDVLAVWRPWTTKLSGRGLNSGHHMAEEIPEDVAAELRRFLQARDRETV